MFSLRRGSNLITDTRFSNTNVNTEVEGLHDNLHSRFIAVKGFRYLTYLSDCGHGVYVSPAPSAKFECKPAPPTSEARLEHNRRAVYYNTGLKEWYKYRSIPGCQVGCFPNLDRT